jgi:hypothetical protein
VVTLLDPGAEPRRELRLLLEEGQTETATMTMHLRLELAIDGGRPENVNVPTLAVSLEFVVEEVTPEGNFRYTYNAADAEFVDPAVDEAQMEDVLDRVRQLHGEVEITPTGRTVAASFGDGGGSGDPVDSALEPLLGQIQNVVVPFPDEPVGAGARWDVRSDADFLGVVTRMRVSYDLEELDEDSVTIGVRTDASADAGKVDMPGVPAGTSMMLDGFTASSYGRSTIRFDSVIPRMTSDGSADIEFAVEVGEQSGRLSQHVEAFVDIEPD